MKRKMKRLLCFLLAAMMCAYMLPLNIFAWSYMTHVNSANLTMMEMLSFAENASGGRRTSPVVQIYAPYDDPENGTYTYSIPNEFYRAIKEYPEAFRAGSLGPDFYPDMVIGQTYIHPYDAEIKIGSGDWLRLLVESANRLPQYSEERLEAVSFILGFMLHYCGDMFGHDFVNTFSGGTFPTLTDVNITDTTTPELNNMMSHMSVESMIDDLMNEAFFGQNEDGIGLPIKAPTRFIADSLLLNGSMKAGAADIYYDFEQASDDGLLSGIPFYIDLIVDLREDVMEVADEYRPNTELFTMAISSYADQWAQDIDRALYALVDTFDMIAHRLVTGEENPKILEETLEDWLINGYPLKEMLKDKLEIDDAEGTVGIIMEELSLWLEDYGWKALGIPDIFIDGLPEEIDDVMKVFTFGIDFILARLKEVFSALFAEIIYAAARGEMLDAIGLASLLDDRLKDPRIQLDHADNPYKPSQNNFNDLVEYLRPYALEQQKLNNKDIRDTIANSDGKGTLAHVTDSEFASFYNTMAMFKMILMGPDNFNSFVKTVTGAAPASAYTKNVGALEATVVRLDVTTYDTEYAGTDDNVYAYVYRVNANGSRTLVGTKLLDNSLENNLEAGHTDSFYIELDEAVGVSQLEIQLGQKGTATANGGWKCENVNVIPMHAGIALTEPIGVGGNLYMDDGRSWDLEFQRALKLRGTTINANTPVTHVKVQIKTGNGDYLDGTDYDVYVGAADTVNTAFSEKVLLDKYLYNDFEDGDNDTYFVPLAEYNSVTHKTTHTTLGTLVLVLDHDSDYDWVIKNITVTPYYGTLALTDPIDFGGMTFDSYSDRMVISPSSALSKGTVSYKQHAAVQLTYATSLDDGLLADVKSLDAGEQWKYIDALWSTPAARKLFFRLFKGFEPEMELDYEDTIYEAEPFQMKIHFSGVWNGVGEARRNALAEYAKKTFGDDTYQPMPAVIGQATVIIRDSKTGQPYAPTTVYVRNQTAAFQMSALDAGTYDIEVSYSAEGFSNQYYSNTEVILEDALIVKKMGSSILDENGKISRVVIEALDAPYHNGPLDKTAVVNSDIVLEQVQYTMFHKELDSVEKGDRISIGVRVNPKNPGATFSKDGRAYWSDLGIYSDTTLLISPTEAVYVFQYTVDAHPDQMIDSVQLMLEKPTIGRAAADASIFSGTEGITVESVTWSPEDTTFRAGVAYTAKVKIDVDSDHLFADDFEIAGTAAVNGNAAKVVCEKTDHGRFVSIQYYVEYTFPEIDYGEDTFKLRVADGETDITINDPNQRVELRVEVSENGSKVPHYRWYRCTRTGSPYDQYTLSNGTMYYFNGIPAEEALEPRFYRCDATIGNTTKSVIFMVTYVPKSPDFALNAIGHQEIYIYEADMDFTLTVDVAGNGENSVDFQWYRCDKDGKTLPQPEYSIPLSMVPSVTVEGGIPASEMLKPRYYRCNAAIGNTVHSVLYTVTLCPMGIEYEIPFKDVNHEDYFAPSVAWAYESGVTAGTGDGTTFSPDATCTRGQVVTFLWRAAGCPEPKSMNNPFTDVKSGDWFFKPVLWAVEQKITQGTSAATFTPERECSTAEILTFLFRSVGAGTNGYYEEAANWADHLGLLKDTGLAVNPTTPCPRKAIVTYLYRIYGK